VPYPASYWATDTYPGGKSLNLALYSDDGSQTGIEGSPTGILFLARRPILLDSVTAFDPAAEGNSVLWFIYTVLSGSNTAQNYIDTAGLYGKGADAPGNDALYGYVPAVPSSSGAGTGLYSGAGGWTIFCHFAPVTYGSGQEAVGATFWQVTDTIPVTGLTELTAGSYQANDTVRDTCAFCLDLLDTVPPSGEAIVPAANFTVSTATTWNLEYTTTDASGETPRFIAVWAGAATWSPPDATPALPAPVTSWTPSSSVTSSLLNGNTGIADVVNFLQYPPMFRSALDSSQSIPNSTNTTVTLATGAALDTFSGQQSATTYEVQRAGLYLCHATTVWGSNTSGQRVTGLTINGTTYWGPGYEATTAGICITTKTAVFSLQAGDTVVVTGRQNSGSALTLSTVHSTRMFMTWLGATTTSGSAETTWTPPDTGYRWQAGTPGRDLPGLFSEHLANDLGFLVTRPYFMGWQASGQTGLSQDAWHPVTLDTITGIVHGDAGDPWSGWSSGNDWWAAPVTGWYLVVGELFGLHSTGNASFIAGLSVPTSGGYAPAVTPDWYQHMLASTNAAQPPGGTVVSLYYLLAGETIQPQIQGQDYGTTLGTPSGTLNGGEVASHMEIIWMSE
jgi:hypothetical protein